MIIFYLCLWRPRDAAAIRSLDLFIPSYSDVKPEALYAKRSQTPSHNNVHFLLIPRKRQIPFANCHWHICKFYYREGYCLYWYIQYAQRRRLCQMHFMHENVFRLTFYEKGILRFQLRISQHWLRLWHDAIQATSQNLNQGWPSSSTHICSPREGFVCVCVRGGGGGGGAKHNLQAFAIRVCGPGWTLIILFRR